MIKDQKPKGITKMDTKLVLLLLLIPSYCSANVIYEIPDNGIPVSGTIELNIDPEDIDNFSQQVDVDGLIYLGGTQEGNNQLPRYRTRSELNDKVIDWEVDALGTFYEQGDVELTIEHIENGDSGPLLFPTTVATLWDHPDICSVEMIANEEMLYIDLGTCGTVGWRPRFALWEGGLPHGGRKVSWVYFSSSEYKMHIHDDLQLLWSSDLIDGSNGIVLGVNPILATEPKGLGGLTIGILGLFVGGRLLHKRQWG